MFTLQNIKGEIIGVNEDIMKWLDDFEDYPDLYNRHTIIGFRKSRSSESQLIEFIDEV